MATFRFYGNAERKPMLWAVEKDSPSGWVVLESHDDGTSWIRNCDQPGYGPAGRQPQRRGIPPSHPEGMAWLG